MISSVKTEPMNDYINITCEDNMELMARYPDNHFDLAIVDPPYGIGMDGGQLGYSKHVKKDWDFCSPPKDYFDQLFRVSKVQVIWGFNHFLEKLPSTKAFIFWNKHQNGYFAEGELAWCSMGTGKYYDRAYQKDIGNKIHPTQKPVELYQWLLTNYAKPGDKILDTHIGSGSIAIAVDSVNKVEGMNLTLTGCELDPEYYAAAMERIKAKTSQKSLFNADL
jgi:site-specific DNA-methyltransferase (adenine-specific)